MSKNLLVFMHEEIKSILQDASSWLTPLLFFIIVVSLFPLAIGTNLTTYSPGIIWVTALLAIVISTSSLFQQDAASGYLDTLLLSSYPLTLLVFCKVCCHWLTHCLPLILISPVLGFLLNLSPHEIMILMATLLLGTPVLSLLGSVGAALLVGVRGHGMLLPILIMPLYIPILIFGTGTLVAVHAGQPIAAYLAIMGALLLFSVAFAPFLSATALRTGVNQ